MSSTLLPFLYQTRTLRLAFRAPVIPQFARSAHSSRRPRTAKAKHDNSIPFEWDPEEHQDRVENGPEQVSTITPSEAEIFKGIFDEIAQGRMPAAKKRPSASQGSPQNLTDSSTSGSQTGDSGLPGQQNSMARSIVEQARVTEFREKFLRRYPKSLRNAAQVALGLYELEPRKSDSGKSRMIELDEGDKDKWAERAKYDRARADELERVESLMKGCETDEALWKVMENEVFSLPKKLGIVQGPQIKAEEKVFSLPKKMVIVQGPQMKPEEKLLFLPANLEPQMKARPASTGKKGKKKTATSESKEPVALEDGEASTLNLDQQKLAGNDALERNDALLSDALERETIEEERRIMDVHGPLYSQFISTALGLFDTAFSHPSPYAFQILPYIKDLGLPSYVLGVSAPFYLKLAKMYWNRFGDANSTLDVLQEMNSAGLYADEEVKDLLAKIRDHLHGCTWGAQGPFVMAMMESPPYDGALTQRLADMEKTVRQSLAERTRDYAS